MTDEAQLDQMMGMTAYDPAGDKVGKIAEIYLDAQTGQPEWALVTTGMFGTKSSFAPLSGSALTDDGLKLTVDKDMVKGAPNLDADGQLSHDEEQELYAYYGRHDDAQPTSASSAGQSVEGGRVEQQASGSEPRSADDSQEALTLSEERLRVGTESRESGQVRLRKRVVTENVTQTVPVQREVAYVERVPVTDENRGGGAAEIGEDELTTTLHEEQPVVQKTVEAVEEVRLGTRQETSEESVTEEIRREQIDVDGDVEDR